MFLGGINTHIFSMQQDASKIQDTYTEEEFNIIVHTVDIWLNGCKKQLQEPPQKQTLTQIAPLIKQNATIYVVDSHTNNNPGILTITYDTFVIGTLFSQLDISLGELNLINASLSPKNLTHIVPFLPHNNTSMESLSLNKFYFNNILLITLLKSLKALTTLRLDNCCVKDVVETSFIQNNINSLALKNIDITFNYKILNEYYLLSLPTLIAFLDKCPQLKNVKIETLLLKNFEEFKSFLSWVKKLSQTVSTIEFNIFASDSLMNPIQKAAEKFQKYIVKQLEDQTRTVNVVVSPEKHAGSLSRPFSIKITTNN